LYQQNVFEVNAAVAPKESEQITSLYCAIVIEVGNTESRVLSTAFVGRPLKKKNMMNFCINISQGKLLLY